MKTRISLTAILITIALAGCTHVHKTEIITDSHTVQPPKVRYYRAVSWAIDLNIVEVTEITKGICQDLGIKSIVHQNNPGRYTFIGLSPAELYVKIDATAIVKNTTNVSIYVQDNHQLTRALQDKINRTLRDACNRALKIPR